MNKITKLLGNNPLIGMIHFPPLMGYKDYPGFNFIEKKMLSEAKILQESGFDAIIIENNYDLPHSEYIPPEAAAMFCSLARTLQENIKIPFGLDILWNDYKTSLSICESTNASFFRVPAFVDSVITNYGPMVARGKEIVSSRKELNLEHIAIIADIQVKHSEMVDKNKSLTQSASEAISCGADAIIVTGKWTGDAPKTQDLEEVRSAAKNFPILIGSGATAENLPTLLKFANGIIVGTALKEGESQSKEKESNLKPFIATLSPQKCQDIKKEFVLCQGKTHTQF
jgi:hypothetical protein